MNFIFQFVLNPISYHKFFYKSQTIPRWVNRTEKCAQFQFTKRQERDQEEEPFYYAQLHSSSRRFFC